MSLPDPELDAAVLRREERFLRYGEEHWLAGQPMDPCAVPADPIPAMPGYPYLPASGGGCALIVSPTGAGKSDLLGTCGYDGARAGIRTLYLGHEISESEFNARAAKLAELRGDPIDQALRDQLANVIVQACFGSADACGGGRLLGLAAAAEHVLGPPSGGPSTPAKRGKGLWRRARFCQSVARGTLGQRRWIAGGQDFEPACVNAPIMTFIFVRLQCVVVDVCAGPTVDA
jgi:hypothetical protein